MPINWGKILEELQESEVDYKFDPETARKLSVKIRQALAMKTINAALGIITREESRRFHVMFKGFLAKRRLKSNG